MVVIKSLSLSLANTHIHTHAQSKDTTGYDEYVEGVEPDETASLERHIGEVGVASHDCSHGNKQMSVCVCVLCVSVYTVHCTCLCVLCCAGQAYSLPASH